MTKFYLSRSTLTIQKSQVLSTEKQEIFFNFVRHRIDLSFIFPTV